MYWLCAFIIHYRLFTVLRVNHIKILIKQENRFLKKRVEINRSGQHLLLLNRLLVGDDDDELVGGCSGCDKEGRRRKKERAMMK